ncbi:hypothetical protein [Streptomyces tauricus]|uniref:hypothetical protein n=1 Tax=Streptomyces tauricus TaxID=68274 RepID=UPI0033A6FC8B
MNISSGVAAREKRRIVLRVIPSCRPVTADDLDAGPLGEPGRERVRLPVGKEIDRATCLDVNEYGSVDTAFALGVHADHAGSCGGGIRKRGGQSQQGVPADRNVEGVRHPGAGPARERKTDRHERRP